MESSDEQYLKAKQEIDLLKVTAWTAPTLLNSWVDYSSTFNATSYTKDSMGFVHIKGLVKSGTPGSTSVIFTLPAGYRPLETMILANVSNNALGQIRISEDGDVIAHAGSGSWFSLDGICFKAER